MHEDPEAGRCLVQVEVEGAPHGQGRSGCQGSLGHLTRIWSISIVPFSGYRIGSRMACDPSWCNENQPWDPCIITSIAHVTYNQGDLS